MTLRGDPVAYKSQLQAHEDNLKMILGKRSTLAEVISDQLNQSKEHLQESYHLNTSKAYKRRKKRFLRKSQNNPIDLLMRKPRTVYGQDHRSGSQSRK
jgi:hypothetical protein